LGRFRFGRRFLFAGRAAFRRLSRPAAFDAAEQPGRWLLATTAVISEAAQIGVCEQTP